MDGIVLNSNTGFGTKKKVVLIANGIDVHGKREMDRFHGDKT